nr:ORF49 [Acipenserid herpesvirus 1]
MMYIQDFHVLESTTLYIPVLDKHTIYTLKELGSAPRFKLTPTSHTLCLSTPPHPLSVYIKSQTGSFDVCFLRTAPACLIQMLYKTAKVVSTISTKGTVPVSLLHLYPDLIKYRPQDYSVVSVIPSFTQVLETLLSSYISDNLPPCLDVTVKYRHKEGGVDPVLLHSQVNIQQRHQHQPPFPILPAEYLKAALVVLGAYASTLLSINYSDPLQRHDLLISLLSRAAARFMPLSEPSLTTEFTVPNDVTASQALLAGRLYLIHIPINKIILYH